MSRWCPTARLVLALSVLPTSAWHPAFSHPLQTVREDFGTTRADYNLSQKDTLFGVYTIDDSYANTPSANPLSSVLEGLREQVASMQEQHVFSPSFLNTVRAGYSRGSYFF